MNTRGFRVLLGSFLASTKRFLKENPWALFIVGFHTLLAACAFLFILQMAESAESLAVAAYFVLVVGVVIQIVLFSRRSRERLNG